MARLIVPFVLFYVAVLGVSSTNYFRKFLPHYRSYFVRPYRQQFMYVPYKSLQPKKIVPAIKSSPPPCKTCPETRPAPSTVAKDGLISKGGVMAIFDISKLPDSCGPLFFDGNIDMFKVPDMCCSEAAGAQFVRKAEEFGTFDGVDGCYNLDPFQDGTIGAVQVTGCYDDGTQFYGEKCGGSNFGEFTDLAHGDCGPTSPKQGSCACNSYLETKTPGCFAVASTVFETDPAKRFGVYFKAEGCVKP